MTRGLAAIVLAGGRARRLGGIDKPSLAVRGRALLDGVLAACHGAEPIVVVGPRRPTPVPVRWEREDPPFAGPLAALAAGLRAVPDSAELTAVLAADLANLRPATVERLTAALHLETSDDRDGAALVDDLGRTQWLCGVWRTAALRSALAVAGDPSGRSLHAVLEPLKIARLTAREGEEFDVDTAEDVRALERE